MNPLQKSTVMNFFSGNFSKGAESGSVLEGLSGHAGFDGRRVFVAD
jgi:hypothetical protein